MFATNSLYLNDRVTCSNSVSGNAECIVGAGKKTNLGAYAVTDQVRAPLVNLRSNSKVMNGVWANEIEAQAMALYTKSGGWAAPKTNIMENGIPATSATTVFVESGKTLTLPSGVYGSVTVRAGASLKLDGAGIYFFNQLLVETNGNLNIVQGSGITEIYTNSFNFRGKILNASASRFLVVINGMNSNFVESGFTGSIWVPNGSLSIGQYNKSIYSGSYFAKNLIVHQDAVINYVPFTRTTECPL